jgi:hypothetical protein
MACKNCNQKKKETQAPEPVYKKATPYKIVSLKNKKKRK